jgi:hypothetical protein
MSIFGMSTTTKMQLKELDLGSPSIKFIVIVFQEPSGIGRGDNNLGDATLSVLAC